MQSQLKLDFIKSLPKKPYCSNDLERGLRVRQLAHAAKHRYVQPNHPNSKLWLVYDIDRDTSPDEITDDLLLPPPHLFVQNPRNGHAHALYGLETPVHMNPGSSTRALRFAGAVDVGMTERIGGDAGYVGLITKNPMHDDWRVWSCATERYELNDLAEFVDLNAFDDRRKRLPAVGIGRNCTLFDQLRAWSYKAIRQGWPDYNRWLDACLDRATGYNAQFKAPLPLQEVQHTAKSVAKWVHSNFNPSAFSALQSARGKKGGRPSLGNPWKEIGISRATYFRRKKSGETKAISDSSPV